MKRIFTIILVLIGLLASAYEDNPYESPSTQYSEMKTDIEWNARYNGPHPYEHPPIEQPQNHDNYYKPYPYTWYHEPYSNYGWKK